MLAHFYILEASTRAGGAGVRPILTGAAPTYTPPGDGHEAVAQLAFLGAIAPDLCFYGRTDAIKAISNLMHHKRTGPTVANMIRRCRSMSDAADRNAALAFTLGYITHIAGDIICHPYVNSFAGEYEAQLQNWVVFNTTTAGPVAMHMFSEVHQDAYIADQHYGCGGAVSNGPNDGSFTSWSDFLDSLITAGAAHWGHNPTGPTVGVMNHFRGALQDTFPEIGAIGAGGLNDALGRAFDALDLGYDTAAGPIVDAAVEDFVHHRFYEEAGTNYDDCISTAVTVATEHLWPAAMAYLSTEESREARKTFLRDFGNWNLDTGYTIRALNQGNQLCIQYESSWARFM